MEPVIASAIALKQATILAVPDGAAPVAVRPGAVKPRLPHGAQKLLPFHGPPTRSSDRGPGRARRCRRRSPRRSSTPSSIPPVGSSSEPAIVTPRIAAAAGSTRATRIGGHRRVLTTSILGTPRPLGGAQRARRTRVGRPVVPTRSTRARRPGPRRLRPLARAPSPRAPAPATAAGCASSSPTWLVRQPVEQAFADADLANCCHSTVQSHDLA